MTEAKKNEGDEVVSPLSFTHAPPEERSLREVLAGLTPPLESDEREGPPSTLPPRPPEPPANRFMVQRDKERVRIRGLPVGSLTTTEARALAAWLLIVSDEVSPDDGEFQTQFAGILAQREAKR